MWERKYQRRFTHIYLIPLLPPPNYHLFLFFYLLSSLIVSILEKTLLLAPVDQTPATRPTPSPIQTIPTCLEHCTFSLQLFFPLFSPPSLSPPAPLLPLPNMDKGIRLSSCGVWKRNSWCGTRFGTHHFPLLSSPPTPNGETYSVKYNKNQVIREEERERETRERRVWWGGEIEMERRGCREGKALN